MPIRDDPFCENCRWFREPGDRCASPRVGERMVPLLHGEEIHMFDAMDVRFARFIDDFCGPAGRWFERKDRDDDDE